MSPVLSGLSISINKVIISNVFRRIVIVSYEQGKNKTEMLQLWLQIEHIIFKFRLYANAKGECKDVYRICRCLW